ncbi:MAG: TlpA family protein disulfide reductase [Dehalococcoidia bacterium]
MAKKKRPRQQQRQRSDSPLEAVRRSDLGKRLLGLLGIGAIVGVAIAVLAAAGLIGGQGGGTTSTGIPIEDVLVFDPPPPPGVTDFDVGVSVDKVAKDFEASRLDTGERVTLSDFRGQPVYLNIFASWCIPCRVEMPDIDQLIKNHPELVVIGINRAEPVGRAQDFLDGIELDDGTKGMRYTVAVSDPDDTLFDEFRGLGMPVSIFIDAEGRITVVQNGLLLLPQMEEAFALTLASAPGDTIQSEGPETGS